jgi:hypothetical protein
MMEKEDEHSNADTHTPAANTSLGDLVLDMSDR